MDYVDLAALEVETYTGVSPETNTRKPQDRRPRPEGYCHYCFEDFEEADTNRLFCDSKCAEGYARANRS